RTQQNFRLHVLAAVLVIIAGGILRISLAEGAILAICVGMVMTAEIFNTAIEKLVDLACPKIDERARFIKDISAAAVLVAALTAVAVGMVILGSRAWLMVEG